MLGDGAAGPVLVLDLFAAEGHRPYSLEAALERKNDLFFGNQTLRFLNAYCDRQGNGTRPIVYLSYRAADHEAGPEKTFDLSRRTLADRETGKLEMEHALERIGSAEELPPLTVIRRGLK